MNKTIKQNTENLKLNIEEYTNHITAISNAASAVTEHWDFIKNKIEPKSRNNLFLIDWLDYLMKALKMALSGEDPNAINNEILNLLNDSLAG